MEYKILINNKESVDTYDLDKAQKLALDIITMFNDVIVSIKKIEGGSVNEIKQLL